MRSRRLAGDPEDARGRIRFVRGDIGRQDRDYRTAATLSGEGVGGSQLLVAT
jgi:hypothetical protein